MEHSELFRLPLCQFVHHVKSKIERILVGKVDSGRITVFILGHLNEAVADEMFMCLTGRQKRIAHDRLRLVGAGQNDGKEQTVASVHGDHDVRRGTVIEDAVALAQVFHVLSYLYLQAAFEHQVKFLPGMLRQMDRLILQIFLVFIAYPVWLGQLFSEHRR